MIRPLAIGWLLALGCAGGAARPSDAGSDARPDQAAGLPYCQLRFSESTANLTPPDLLIAYSCPGERTDDGMGHPFIDFQPGDMQGGVVRTFSIWQFETRAPTGTVLRVEDGYDELASRGVSVRYLEIEGNNTNTWRGDRGVVRLASTRDEAYTLELIGVHMIPGADPFATNHATGHFQLDGTIVTVLP
ncbi:MAG TPA: hypothetical protein VN914_11735 [Polyangia bacterium]|nr:hypothetical protein [Polyangia bacterium]